MSQKFNREFTKVKPKCQEKIGSAWFIYKKWKVISTIHKLCEYNFWWNCLEPRDKVDQTIQVTIFDIINNVITQFV